MVWEIGPLYKGTGLLVFRVRFFFRLAEGLLSSDPGGGQVNLATHTVAQDGVSLSYFLFR